jgi:hypothetical protein
MAMTFQEIAASGQRAREQLSQTERDLNKQMLAIEDAAIAAGRAMTAAEKEQWDERDAALRDVLRRKKQVADATAMALDASPDAVALRKRFQSINRDLEKTKEQLEDIADTAKKVAKAIQIIEQIVANVPLPI